MKDRSSIHENKLDDALNALFLETYSTKEDEGLARFVLDQDYDVIMTEDKKKKLLTKLNRGRGGLFLLLLLIGLVATVILPVYFSLKDKKAVMRYPNSIQSNTRTLRPDNISSGQQITEPLNKDQDNKTAAPTLITSTFAAENGEIITVTDTIKPIQPEAGEKKEPLAENKKKPLPYFDDAGLAYFQVVKDLLLTKILKLDEQFYTKIEPGSTKYKNQEALVSPFVMSNLPVTNLHYKVFLADLFRRGKMDDLEKCLPKQEVWNEYACGKLAKTYFESEYYNDFPVVNIGKEAMLMFCAWMEEEMNKKLAAPKRMSSKMVSKKKEVSVRLPYDYEWIYSADAAYAIIPDCGGYNTIYDPSEGLVDKSFFKRTSQTSQLDKRKLNRIDILNDLNRFGMTESEMIAVYTEAMHFNGKKAGSADPSFSGKMENCCLAGHVVELIYTKDGGTTLRGCCWKDKEDYLKMAGTYKKFNASPFVGFRVVFVTKNGTYKEPFW